MCCFRECKRPRYGPWYVCLNHWNSIRVLHSIEPSMKAHRPLSPVKPRGGSDGGNRPEYAEPLSISAVAGK